MNRLDELAGWAAANEDQLRAFIGHLDELVADRVPVAIELAERMRAAASRGWEVGFDQGHQCLGQRDVPFNGVVLARCRLVWPNPYEAEAGGSS